MKKDKIKIEGPMGTMQVDQSDKLAVKLAMIFEGTCLSKHPTKVAAKYGYSKQRYYQILRQFEEGGTAALQDRKKGPKKNYVRTQSMVNQILRYKFLDPDSPAEVIAQKMTQSGHKISTRSVERTITEYGLQKKTSSVKSR